MNLYARCWPAYARLLQRGRAPILAGPWRGEVGFEALYWIPFLKRFVKRYGIDPNRVHPITRGGAEAWYGLGDGDELYDLRTPQDVRVENRLQHQKYHMLKQMRWTPFDRAVMKEASEGRRFQMIHPLWMYARLTPFFNSAMGLHDLEQDCLYEPLTVPALPEGLVLPERFVAVRFYLRHTFPGHPQIVAFARESIRTMAQHTPVILLNTGIHADDHQDIYVKDIPNVFTLTDLCAVTPANNLAIQSAVIGRALGFVGTYGGLAQLALRLGKPSVSYYSEWSGTAMAHKHLADAIALNANLPCLVLKVGELPLLQSVCPALQLV